jgi:DNA-binding response OmpR family regulator
MSGGARVLLVDDDRDLVAALRLAFERKGYRVSAAYDASSGLRMAEEERPDLIVLDVMMPSATEGFHFVWELRRREGEYFRAVPILVLTAIHEKTDLRFYPDSTDGTYKAGEFLPVQDFLDKPVDPERLLARVGELLQVSRSR